MIPLSVIRKELVAAGLTIESTCDGLLLKGPSEVREGLLRPDKPAQLPPLPPQQRKALEVIRSLAGQKGYAPSVREIAGAMGLRGSSTVHAHLMGLKEKGYIEYGEGPRKIQLLA